MHSWLRTESLQFGGYGAITALLSFEAATAQVCRAHHAGQDRPARSTEGAGATGWRARPLASCGNDLSRALGGLGQEG